VRAAITIITVIMFSVPSLFIPWIGVLAYTWFALMRPDYFSWSAGLFPYSAVLEAVVLVGAARKLGGLPVLFQNPITVLFLLMQIPFGLSVLGAVDPKLCEPFYSDFVRMSVIVLLIPILIDGVDKLYWLFVTIILSLGAVSFKFGVFGLRWGGVAFHEGYGGLDNNGLALAMVMLIPFCWYFRQLTQTKWMKAMAIGFVLTSIATVVMSGSRSAALSLGVCMAVITLRSRYKIFTLVLMALLFLPTAYVFYDRFSQRMGTIGKLAADDSINARLTHFAVAYRMWTDYPLFGVGYGNDNYMALQGRYMDISMFGKALKVHNGYLQVLVDSGIFAFILYVALVVCTIWLLQGSIRRCRKLYPQFTFYPYAMQTALIAYAQFSFSGGRERYEFAYIIFMTAAAWLLIEKKIQLEKSASLRGLAPGAAQPISPPGSGLAAPAGPLGVNRPVMAPGLGGRELPVVGPAAGMARPALAPHARGRDNWAKNQRP